MKPDLPSTRWVSKKKDFNVGQCQQMSVNVSIHRKEKMSTRDLWSHTFWYISRDLGVSINISKYISYTYFPLVVKLHNFSMKEWDKDFSEHLSVNFMKRKNTFVSHLYLVQMPLFGRAPLWEGWTCPLNMTDTKYSLGNTSFVKKICCEIIS